MRPDPRSPWQADGVHGMSAVVDHRTFAWTDDRWRGVSLRGAVLYELDGDGVAVPSDAVAIAGWLSEDGRPTLSR